MKQTGPNRNIRHRFYSDQWSAFANAVLFLEFQKTHGTEETGGLKKKAEHRAP